MLTFHETFEICPGDTKVFTDIRNFRGVGRMSLGRYDTTVFQACGPRYHEWVSNRFSFEAFLFSDHRLEVINLEYISDNLQFCSSRRYEYFPAILLTPFCQFVFMPF